MSAAEKDIAYWTAWRAKPTSDNLHNLLKQVTPVLHNAVKANQGTLSPNVIMAEAKIQAVGAFKTFDPKMGVKLSTHLTNSLQKVNRLNYKYQEVFEVPEQRRIKFKTYQNTKTHLEETLNRQPTSEELAHELHWSMAEIERFEQESRKELSDSQPISSGISGKDTTQNALEAYIYHDLPTPEHKLVFEHTTGYGGKAQLSNPEIMKKLKITQGQLSYYKKTLRDITKNAQGRDISG